MSASWKIAENAYKVLDTCRTVLTAVFGGMRSADNIKQGGSAGFKPFCG